jgi:hypothetical protein
VDPTWELAEARTHKSSSMSASLRAVLGDNCADSLSGTPKGRSDTMEFVKSETFHPADFTIRADGVVRLNPQLARHVVSMVQTNSSLARRPVKTFSGKTGG